MSQAPFAYAYAPVGAANDVPVGLSLAVFADRPHMLAQLREDAINAGFHVTATRALASLGGGEALALGEVVLVDCPLPDGAALAALSRLDLRVAQAGAQLIVSTTIEALDDVFGCVDQSGAQLLVDPGRADFVLALGRVRALGPRGRVRELGQEDRLALLRLTEQVGEIAARLETFGAVPRRDDWRRGDRGRDDWGGVAAPAIAFNGKSQDEGGLLRRTRPALPDPRLVRRVIRERQLRCRFFDGELFADPAWDMLLDLTAARAEMKRVSVTSLCIAANVPPTTALRWIGQMVAAGLFQRVEDMSDRRRAFIELSDRAADAMAQYFAALDERPTRAN